MVALLAAPIHVRAAQTSAAPNVIPVFYRRIGMPSRDFSWFFWMIYGFLSRPCP
jgi:hypothetical protein